jgi:predicted aldo/keto reductase-like oxidoreductase
LKRGGTDWNLAMMYKTLSKRAENCIDCGICVSQCPQKIDIPHELQAAHETLKGWNE